MRRGGRQAVVRSVQGQPGVHRLLRELTAGAKSSKGKLAVTPPAELSKATARALNSSDTAVLVVSSEERLGAKARFDGGSDEDEPADLRSHPAVLLAALGGVPVVTTEWALASVSAGTWSFEQDEVERFALLDKPTRERLAGCKIFNNRRVGVIGNLDARSAVAVELLTVACGGTFEPDDQENVDLLIAWGKGKGKGKTMGKAKNLAASVAAQCISPQMFYEWILYNRKPESAKAVSARRRSSSSSNDTSADDSAATPSAAGRRQSLDKKSAQKSAKSNKAKARRASTSSTTSLQVHLDSATSQESNTDPRADSGKTKSHKGSTRKSRSPAAAKTAPSASSSSSSSVGKVKLKPDAVVIAASGLPPAERDVVVRAAKAFGASMATDQVASTATHVVVPTLDRPKRTLKVMNGIARGAWIVKASWIYESLDDGTWTSEDQHEATQWFPGCKTTRELRQKGTLGGQLLHGVKCYLDGATKPPPAVMARLIRSANGTTVQDASRAHVILCSAKAHKERLKGVPPKSKKRKGVQKETWLFDGIQNASFDLSFVQDPSTAQPTTPVQASSSKKNKKDAAATNPNRKKSSAVKDVRTPGLAKSGKSKARNPMSIEDVVCSSATRKSSSASKKRASASAKRASGSKGSASKKRRTSSSQAGDETSASSSSSQSVHSGASADLDSPAADDDASSVGDDYLSTSHVAASPII